MFNSFEMNMSAQRAFDVLSDKDKEAFNWHIEAAYEAAEREGFTSVFALNMQALLILEELTYKRFGIHTIFCKYIQHP